MKINRFCVQNVHGQTLKRNFAKSLRCFSRNFRKLISIMVFFYYLNKMQALNSNNGGLNYKPNYVIVASQIVRPHSWYKVVVSYFDEQEPLWIHVWITYNGVHVSENKIILNPPDTKDINLPIKSHTFTSQQVTNLFIKATKFDDSSVIIFENSTLITYSPKFLAITISTNRLVYTGSQLVRIRVIFLTAELLPFSGISGGTSVQIFVTDPNGIIMRKWNSVQLNVGLAAVQFRLPSMPKIGFWKIGVKCEGQYEELPIKVELYYIPKFECKINMPLYVSELESEIEATVEASYVHEHTVYGDVRIKWMAAPLKSQKLNPNSKFDDIIEETTKWIEIENNFSIYKRSKNSGGAVHTFHLSLDRIEKLFGERSNVLVRLFANFTDYFYNDTSEAFSTTVILESKLDLNFVGQTPTYFKPGFTFEIYFVVSNTGFRMIPFEILSGTSVKISSLVMLNNGTLFQHEEKIISIGDVERNNVYNIGSYGWLYPLKKGLFKMVMKTLDTSYLIQIIVDFIDSTGSKATHGVTQLNSYLGGHSALKANQDLIHIVCSTKNVEVGKFAIFHIHSTFVMSHFVWVVVSKNVVVHSGIKFKANNDQYSGRIVTFSIAVSPSMAPGSHVIVYTLLEDGTETLITDSIYLPVDGFNRHKVLFGFNQAKNHYMTSVEAYCSGDASSAFLSSSFRIGTYAVQAKNSITKNRLLESLYSLETKIQGIHKLDMVLPDEVDGQYQPQESYFFPSANIGNDIRTTFLSKNLILLASRGIYLESAMNFKHDVDSFSKYASSLNQDLHKNVTNFICHNPRRFMDSHLLSTNYLLSRENRFIDFYDADDGDWGRISTNIDEDQNKFIKLEIPEAPDIYLFDVLGLSHWNGIGLYEKPIAFSTIRPLDFYCSAPSSIRRGETVGIRCIVLNRTPNDIEAMLILDKSPNYSFVHVEKFGFVTSYAPRVSSGKLQHLIFAQGGSDVQLHIPISIHIQMGNVQIDLKLSSQILSVSQTVYIEILPEGSRVERHTSLLLDLRTRANVLAFLKIDLDKLPIVPYEIYRRYIFGSSKAHISVSGDVIGPIFPNGEYITMERGIFGPGNLRQFGKGSEYHSFNLAINCWHLHYLRLTNQLTSNWELALRIFEDMNTEYIALMRRFSYQGWFSYWDDSRPSVWLTAWALRILSSIANNEWEDYIYIDSNIFELAITWMLKYQKQDGSFTDKSSNGTFFLYGSDETLSAHQDISLTAQVVICLSESTVFLSGGDDQAKVALARVKAVEYLERELNRIESVSELAITVYALIREGSSFATSGYSRLMHHARYEDGMVFWSETLIKTNKIRHEFNRPFLEPKELQLNDAMAVETTSYALLSMILFEGGSASQMQDKAIQWLSTMRLGNSGFISTVDTVIATEAIVKYTYNSRIKDVSELSIQLNSPDSNINQCIKLQHQNVTSTTRIEIENVWGHLNIYAKGTGYALVQLDYEYGVDFEPFKDKGPLESFRLSIDEAYSGRNKSEIRIRSCFSWIASSSNTKEEYYSTAASSSMAVLVVEIPSGYVIEQTAALAIVASRIVPEMTDADVITKSGKTIWFFERILNQTRCFDHTVKRYLPVANLTRTRQALIMELHRPENFVITIFNSTSLYSLSICEVCGSYQCPYCPFYSKAAMPASRTMLLIPTTLAMLFFV